MKICLYQLLFVVSLFVVVVQSTDVSEEAVVAVVTSTTRKPYLRSLWDTWTANSSPSTNVGTTNANNAQEQSVSRCSLCHDGSYPKNPNHGVTVGFHLYSFQGTCGNLYYDLQSKVYSTDQICNPLQDRFDWPCGCNANYQAPQAPVGSVNMNQGYGTWNVGGP